MLIVVARRVQRQARTILSFGCATGEEIATLQECFPGATVHGLEIQPEAARAAEEAFPGQVFTRVPEGKTYDLVVAMNVLSGTKRTPLPFERFVAGLEAIAALSHRFLFVFGTNYQVQRVPFDAFGPPVFRDAGAVVVYTPEGVAMPRKQEVYLWARRVGVEQKVAEVEVVEEVAEEEVVEEEVVEKVEEKKEEAKGVTLGVFWYRNSKNIGDYYQSMAQISALAAFQLPEWTFESEELRSAFEWFRRRGNQRVAHAVRRRVHVRWVERDSTQSEPLPGPVYVVANGWYMHATQGRFELPFGPHVRPLFVSFHCARPEILTGPAREYLRRYGPVGCRDEGTVRLLRARGVPAYFTGCLTLTLVGPAPAAAVPGKEFGVDLHPRHLGAVPGKTHMLPEMQGWGPDRCLAVARGMMEEYRATERIRSIRIHCVMPMKALGVPCCEFTSKDGDNNESWNARTRFSGLVDNMEDPARRETLALGLFQRLQETLDALLVRGLDEADVYRVFRGEVEYPDLARSRAWGRGAGMGMRLALPDRVFSRDKEVLHFARVPSSHPDPLLVLRYMPTAAPFERVLTFVLTIDQKFQPLTPGFLVGLTRQNPESLFRVFVLTRGIESLGWLRGQTQALPNLLLVHRPVRNDLSSIYRTTLSHISVSCLDRLLIPSMDFGESRPSRVVYMDVDILVRGDVRPFFTVPTGPRGLVAKTSRTPNVTKNWLRKHGTARVTYPHRDGFNAGVLVLDLEKIGPGATEEWVGMCRDNDGINDQIILNVWADNEYARLDPSLNVFVGQDKPGEAAYDAGVCFHFIGSKKPWTFERAESYPHAPELWDAWHANQRFLHADHGFVKG